MPIQFIQKFINVNFFIFFLIMHKILNKFHRTTLEQNAHGEFFSLIYSSNNAIQGIFKVCVQGKFVSS